VTPRAEKYAEQVQYKFDSARVLRYRMGYCNFGRYGKTGVPPRSGRQTGSCSAIALLI